MSAATTFAVRFAPLLLAAFLVLAPLFRGGKVPLAILLLQLLAVAAFLLLWWGSVQRDRLARAEICMLVALALLPLLQLLPLPGVTRADLAGQAGYFLALQAAGIEQAITTLSAIPRETLAGWLLLLVPIAVYLLTRAIAVRSLHKMITLMLVVAALEAVLGLVQFGTFPSQLFYLNMEFTHLGSAVGTYSSRNSFVGFMYLSLMLSLALFMCSLGRGTRSDRNQSLRARLRRYASADAHRAFSYGALALLLLLAIIFTRSRAGIALTLLGIMLTSVAFSRRIGGGNVFGVTGSIVSAALGVSIAIGLGTVLERFTNSDALSDGRWIIFEGVVKGIGQFFPFGAGIGTFQQTFPQFQDLSQATYFINRAHNSYLEWVYGGGLLAIALIVAFLLLFVVRWFRLWKRGDWGEFRYVQVGAGLGMLLMLLHELVDYNLFIPANMVYFAFMAGVFMTPYQEPVRAPQKRASADAAAALKPLPSDPRTVALLPPGAEPEKNPFMD